MRITVLACTGIAAAGLVTDVSARQVDFRVGLAKCSAISSSVARLDCFDSLVKVEPTSPLETPASENLDTGAGKWEIDTKTNPVDDSKTVVLALREDGSKAVLILRCLQGKPEVYIGWVQYLGSDEPRVLTRVGDQLAETKRWSLSTDKRATFYPGDDGQFMRQLEKTDRFVAQVTPYSESPVTAVFDVRGLTNALPSLATTCKLP